MFIFFSTHFVSSDDTLGLKKAREALFGSQTQQNTKPVSHTFEQAASKLSQFTDEAPKAPNEGPSVTSGPAGGAKLVRPTGVFVTEEGLVSGKRYADRPEGIDQFGAEEAERDPAFPAESEARLNAAALARYKDRPEGIDQFGGEDSERDRVELKDGETRLSERNPEQLRRFKDWPEGVDQFGGEQSERVVVELQNGERREVKAEDFKRFMDQPQGLDLFGGEEAERKA